LYEKEFSRDPSYRSKAIVNYAVLLAKADKASAGEKIKPFIQEIDSKKDKSETDYQTIMAAYQRIGDKESAEKMKATILEKYPAGMEARVKRLNQFYDEKDLEKKEAILNALVKDFPPKTDLELRNFDNMYSTLASAAATKDDWTRFKKYEQLVRDKENLAGAYNNIAWKFTGESLDAEPGDLVMAKDLSGKSLEYVKASMTNPQKKPAYLTLAEYKKNQQFTLGMYSDTYALILWKLGQKEEALKYQEDAVKQMNNGDHEANERYVIFKEELHGPASVKEQIVGYVKEGKSSPKIKELLKKAFIAEGHKEAEFAAYEEGLMQEYKVKLREDLIKKMISESAPKFALKDLAGKTVSLDDLKGKVVVVDFWATWCGPCIASFPGMQIAMNKYKDDPGVKFVFVDTWENKKPEEMQKDASEFMAKKKYDFHVVLDTDDKIVTSYGVQGIPTKFVIDGDSRIRFKSIGYDGSADKLVDEISIIVDALKTGTKDGAKKGF
jgi:thiol-disulfide isomerase/thioredoxin